MLQSIRDRTQGWIAGIIISLLILSFALWGIHSYLVGGGASTTVAEVNGVAITKSQLAIAYERLHRQLQAQNTSNDLNNANLDAGLKDRALQALINIQVLKQASIKQDFYISPLQVDAYLENMPEFQQNGQFSLSRFQYALSTTMYSPLEFLELIKTSLLIDQPRLGTIFSSFSLPNEVDENIALINQERDIDYVIFPYQLFSNMNVVISKEMIQHYYDQHQAEFKTPEKVSVEYLELAVKNLIDKIKPTETELRQFYNENTNAFATPMQWKIQTLTIPSDKQTADIKTTIDVLYEKAQKGSDLTSLSKTYSAIKPVLSDAMWVTQNQVAADLQKPLSAIQHGGEVIPPVKDKDGFIIVKVLDFKDAEIPSFEKVNDKVKELYVHQKVQELFAELREKLANLTYQYPESLESASKELGLPIKTTELFTIDKGSDDLSSHNKIREAAFSNDVLTLQNNSDVIQKNSDSAVVIRVKSHVPSSLLALNVVQQQIANKLKVAEIDKKAMQELTDISKQLNAGADPAQVIKTYGLSWQKLGFMTRHSTKVDSALLDQAFDMPKPSPGKTTYSVAKLPTGYAIIGLHTVQNGKLAQNETYEVYADQSQNAQGLLEYGLYKLSLMNNAKIVDKSPH